MGGKPHSAAAARMGLGWEWLERDEWALAADDPSQERARGSVGGSRENGVRLCLSGSAHVDKVEIS